MRFKIIANEDILGAYNQLQERCEAQSKELAALSKAQKRIKTERDRLRKENEQLREAVAKALFVEQTLCADKDQPYCNTECPLHRPDSRDCMSCDIIDIAQDLHIEPYSE